MSRYGTNQVFDYPFSPLGLKVFPLGYTVPRLKTFFPFFSNFASESYENVTVLRFFWTLDSNLASVSRSDPRFPPISSLFPGLQKFLKSRQLGCPRLTPIQVFLFLSRSQHSVVLRPWGGASAGKLRRWIRI